VGAAAQALPYDTTYRSTYYEQKRTLYEALPNTRGEIIFLGNSITDTAEWSELFGNKHVKNRGISGDITFGVLARLGEVTASKPAKVFLLIGINDLSRNIPANVIFRNYQRIVQRIRAESPRTKIYLQSILPTNGSFPNFPRHQGRESQLKFLNDKLQELAAQTGQTFVDLRPTLADAAGRLDARYTNDGLHLNGAGYLRWVAFLRQHHWMK
jgi:lysophospholipase L1-like esterase